MNDVVTLDLSQLPPFRIRSLERCADVPARLRQSKEQCDKEAYARGETLGREWAEHFATADQLETLHDDVHSIIPPDCSKHTIHGLTVLLDAKYHDLVDFSAKRTDANSQAFLDGYIRGALKVYCDHSDIFA